jgi:hypothetical protein
MILIARNGLACCRRGIACDESGKRGACLPGAAHVLAPRLRAARALHNVKPGVASLDCILDRPSRQDCPARIILVGYGKAEEDRDTVYQVLRYVGFEGSITPIASARYSLRI